jgi:hypothetical protein
LRSVESARPPPRNRAIGAPSQSPRSALSKPCQRRDRAKPAPP